uniref:Uncharacterized protein n=1 Tax=Arundo donax TaxID=35708 RepID=A0A0A9AT05_ARUDO
MMTPTVMITLPNRLKMILMIVSLMQWILKSKVNFSARLATAVAAVSPAVPEGS